jgi:hypothetical protein
MKIWMTFERLKDFGPSAVHDYAAISVSTLAPRPRLGGFTLKGPRTSVEIFDSSRLPCRELRLCSVRVLLCRASTVVFMTMIMDRMILRSTHSNVTLFKYTYLKTVNIKIEREKGRRWGDDHLQKFQSSLAQ